MCLTGAPGTMYDHRYLHSIAMTMDIIVWVYYGKSNNEVMNKVRQGYRLIRSMINLVLYNYHCP